MWSAKTKRRYPPGPERRRSQWFGGQFAKLHRLQFVACVAIINFPGYRLELAESFWGHFSKSRAVAASMTRVLNTLRFGLLSRARKAPARARPHRPHWRTIKITSLGRFSATPTKSSSSNTVTARSFFGAFLTGPSAERAI